MGPPAEQESGRSNPPGGVSGRTSILFRMAVLSWIVTILALGLFILFIIPYQESILIDRMEFAAEVVATSLDEVTVNSIVLEDYSRVVDHCMKVVRDRPTVLYLVITRNDGFSLLHTADTWSHQTLDDQWKLAAGSGSRATFVEGELVGEQVFQYTYPLRYTGIDWGWIHIGLSLEQFAADLRSIYVRTILLGVLCVLISSVVSLVFARRLNRPIRQLDAVSRRVAAGDLDVQADIDTNDEVGSLGRSFNQMTHALRKARDELEERVEERTAELSHSNRLLQQEIAQRQQVEGELRESEEQYRDLVESINDVIYSVDTDGRVTYTSPVVESVSGYLPSDVIGRPFADFVYPEDLASFTEHFQQGLVGDSGVTEGRMLNKEGEIRWIRVSNRPVLVDGRVVGLRGVLSDVTERKQAERQREELEARVQRAERMEALGNLAGGVAHDLNNILSGILSYPDLLLSTVPEGSPLRDPLLTIRRSGENAAAVVQDLLTLTRRGMPLDTSVSTNETITEFLHSPEYDELMTRHPGVAVETHLADDLLDILGSPVHLSTTVMNLVFNAVEAMPDGGTLTISTRNQYLDRPVEGYDRVEEGDYLMVTFSDTGMGIPPEDVERIFEPFYTKKEMGRSGTGLGMTVVWNTVKDHRGYIDLESTVGRGTTFTLYFPATRQAVAGDSSVLSKQPYRGKGESILVVDDVAEQGGLASVILERLGYSATAVASGEEAVEYLREHAVDLLILDMIMEPGLDGLDTFKKVRELRPDQKAIIVSGFSETDRVREAQSLGAGAYVRKPYLLETLGTCVRQELDAP